MKKAWYFWIGCTTAASLLAAADAANSIDDEILIEDFRNPIHTWKQMNDPVMGGRSTGSFHIDEKNGIGVFEGEVVDVPFLQAPGFIQARTIDHVPFPDVTFCSALQLELRSDHPEYMGYRVSFGNRHAPGGKMFAYGFKSNLDDVATDLSKIVIPFSSFTDYWDDATGDPIETCQKDPRYCPDAATLRNMKTIAVWGEGVAGLVSVEITSIHAVHCNEEHAQEEGEEKASKFTGVAERYKQQFLRGLSNQWSSSLLVWNQLLNR